MRRVCPVDVAALVAALPLLDWSAGREPGEFSWITDWPPEMPVKPMFSTVATEYPDRRRGLTCFGRLTPGQFIEPHVDGFDSKCPVRIHVPIVTNPSCFHVEVKHALHLAAGWAWQVNPSVRHCVGNGGDTDRVHLFFNMVPI